MAQSAPPKDKGHTRSFKIQKIQHSFQTQKWKAVP